MNADKQIAASAALMADPTRAAILLALLDGRARTAGELAMITHASAQSVSGHLAKLAKGDLIRMQPQGRHRYFRLSGPDVAHVVEALTAFVASPVSPAPQRAPAQLLFARCCYDHLAGQLGVSIADALQARGLLELTDRDFSLTEKGVSWCVNLGLDIDALRDQRRAFARACLDWTERRPHVAGALGAALLSMLLQKRWLEHANEPRMLRLTPQGRAALGTHLGLYV